MLLINLRNLGGRITGDAVALTARTDLDNIGDTFDADSALLLKTGRDINVSSTIAPATPFAMSETLPPEVWQAISIFLMSAK